MQIIILRTQRLSPIRKKKKKYIISAGDINKGPTF